MGPVSGIVVYICIWWTVIFCILPFGIERDVTETGAVGPGAPKNARIREKFIATTLVSAFLWLGIYALMAFDVIDFREIAAKMSQNDYNP
jgi:predicted secreted protein